jgi:hypothetical protein
MLVEIAQGVHRDFGTSTHLAVACVRNVDALTSHRNSALEANNPCAWDGVGKVYGMIGYFLVATLNSHMSS